MRNKAGSGGPGYLRVDACFPLLWPPFGLGLLANLDILVPEWRTLHTQELDSDVSFNCMCLKYVFECAKYKALVPSEAEMVRIFRCNHAI